MTTYEGEKIKRTEKKNIQSCRDPIQDIVDADRCWSWCEAYQAWKVPNAFNWPNVQDSAMKAPRTVKYALRPPSGNWCNVFPSRAGLRSVGGVTEALTTDLLSKDSDMHMVGSVIGRFSISGIL